MLLDLVLRGEVQMLEWTEVAWVKRSHTLFEQMSSRDRNKPGALEPIHDRILPCNQLDSQQASAEDTSAGTCVWLVC